MIIKLLIEGGDMKPGPAIAQQLGPLGINMGKVISDVNASTKHFKGMKVPVEIDVDKKTKDFKIKTFSPPTSELLKKELHIEKGSNQHKTVKVGNASIEDIIKITKIKHDNMLEKTLKSAVKSVLGTCTSIGTLVENKEPIEVIADVEAGKYDKEINSESTETSPEKRKKLNDYFNELSAAQAMREQLAKKASEEAEAKKEADKKAAPAAAPAATGAKGAAPAKGAAAKAPAAKPAAGAKGAAAKAPAKKK